MKKYNKHRKRRHYKYRKQRHCKYFLALLIIVGGVLLLVSDINATTYIGKLLTLEKPTTIYEPIETEVLPQANSMVGELFEDEEKLFSNSENTQYELLFGEYRVENGLSPLVFADRLNELAQVRAEEIKKDFSHSGLAKYGNFGENIAMGIHSEDDAITMWDSSPQHKANMLSPSYILTGYARIDGYAVQVFY